MSRQVKLQDKGIMGTSDNAFKAPNGKYYSSKEVWEFLHHENELRIKCLEKLSEYMGYTNVQQLPTIANKRVKEFKDRWGYDVLLTTIEEQEDRIRKAMTKNFESDGSAVIYIFAILNSYIGPVYRRKAYEEKQQSQMNRSFEVEDKPFIQETKQAKDVSGLIGGDNLWT